MRPSGTVRIRVRPYADLGRFFPGAGRIRELEIPAGTTVGALLAMRQVPADESLTIGINDQLATRAAELHDGDVMDVVAPMVGGV